MNKPSLSRSLPMSKPTGPETYEISKGASVWPELRHVHRSEREDLETVLRSHGRSPDEFYVSDTPSRIDPPRFDGNGVIVGPVTTDVIVRSRTTGKARAYTAGNTGPTASPFVDWVNQFAEDLDNGLFE
jgi:hypothetical protein